VRLTGCPLRCAWCDTTYAYSEGTLRSVRDVVDEVLAFETPLVCVTGGEPLAQTNALGLMRTLAEAGKTVLLETSGAFDVRVVDPRVRRVIDMKAPSSGQTTYMLFANLDALGANDEAKIVICDEADYEWARDLIRSHDLASRTTVLLSTVFGRYELSRLAERVLADRLQVRVQPQLHKLMFGSERRGV